MKSSCHCSLLVTFIFTLVASLNGCTAQPSSGKQMILEDDNSRILAHQWDQGSDLLEHGEKDLQKGEKMIKKGKKLVQHGETKIQHGKRLIKQGDQMMHTSENSLHQDLNATVANEQIYKDKEQRHLSHKWQKGHKLVEKGKSAIKEGHALRYKGKNLIHEGKLKIKRGNELKEEGNKIIENTELTFHQAIATAKV